MPLEPRGTATERCDRALALLIGRERRLQGEPPPPLLRAASGRLRGRHRPRGARTATYRPRRLLLVGFLNDLARIDRSRRRAESRRRSLRLSLVFAKTFLGFSLGLALGLLVVAAAIVLVALARLGTP